MRPGVNSTLCVVKALIVLTAKKLKKKKNSPRGELIQPVLIGVKLSPRSETDIKRVARAFFDMLLSFSIFSDFFYPKNPVLLFIPLSHLLLSYIQSVHNSRLLERN